MSYITRDKRMWFAAGAATLSLGLCAAGSPTKTADTLLATPSSIVLRGPYSESRLLLASNSADVSSKAQIVIADTRVATIDDFGIVRPGKDGSTVLKATVAGKTVAVPIRVSGVAVAGAPRFVTDVMPVITKAGCNQGACHGAGSGKGGFKLSLLGYDPDSDYATITRGAMQRRISRTQPENSLIIRKATLRAAHKGGQRFRVGSPEYKLLCDWIAWGMPGPKPDEPALSKLEVFPQNRVMSAGQTQRFVVKATYSDGTKRDVTGETIFTASEEAVAKVSPDGEAKTMGPGEGAVLVRYRDLVATARVLSPYQAAPATKPAIAAVVRTQLPNHPITQSPTRIDALIDQKLKALNLPASGRCSESDFLRRAYLDVIGTLPTAEEAKVFLADKDPNKRDRLIDSLFDRAEYVDFWTLRWGDLLRSSRKYLSDRALAAFNGWIRKSVQENKPWNQMARELIIASGSTYEGPANFFKTASTPETQAETTSQVFLGVRIQCARCHNHPYEKWKQNQYYQMAAFFARVRTRKGRTADENYIIAGNSGEERHPKTNKNVAPCALDARPVPATYDGDRRTALADWITSPQNPFFAKIIVNRVWRHYMGRGLVEPVDDLRVTNPASNEPLFNWLAEDFVKHGYDLRQLMKTIMRTAAYQRDAEPAAGAERDAKFYSHYLFKRLTAEQLEDAIASATGVAEKFPGFPAGMRAAQLPDSGVPSYFLDLFGRPARNITCECERNDDPNLGQVLHLMNNKGINERLSDKKGRVTALIDSKKPDKQVIEQLYLSSLSRHPSIDEMKRSLAQFAKSKSRQQAGEDLLWALINSKEFLFNH